MDFILLIYIFITVYGASSAKTIPNDYLLPSRTNAINGIFVVTVFLRHFKTYIECGRFDRIFFFVDSRIGQLLVVPFLFFSGYGIMYSIANKSKYIKKLPVRFLKVILEFDIVIMLFIGVNLMLGNDYSVSQTLLSLIAWENIGNSNWYIFAVLVLYIITYISFMIPSKNHIVSVTIVTLLTIGYIALLIAAGKESWWYNTVIAYPAGMIFYLYKDRFDKFVAKNSYIYFILLIGILGCFAVTYKFQRFIALYAIMDICFMLILMMISMKVKIGNKCLDFLGKYTFEIYILQRIPFMICERYISNPYVIFVISIAVTCILAIVLKKLFTRLFSPIEKKILAVF